MTITIIARDSTGKIVAQETVHDSNAAARITKEWTASGLTVERINQ